MASRIQMIELVRARDLLSGGEKIVEQAEEVEEDKQDVQNQPGIGVIPVPQRLNKGEGLEGKHQAGNEYEGDEGDKENPETGREDIPFCPQDQGGCQACGREGQEKSGDGPMIGFFGSAAHGVTPHHSAK